ncbi:MAG: hypothetical protein GYA52_05765 [Chloroflexi bacterium]|jgi:hypothetical protein|nr:hypothetical protein [Chloroflexota bacterium]
MDDLGLRDRDEVLVNDRLAAVVWAVMLLWTGTCLLAGFNHWVADWHLPNLVWFPFLRDWLGKYAFDFRVTPLLLLGNAAILALELILRVAVKRYRHNLTALIMYMFIFLGLAVGSSGLFEPVILIPGFFLALGASVLFGTLLQK